MEGDKMKRMTGFLVGIFIFGTIFLNPDIQQEKSEEVLVVYYFGATSIGFCVAPENIQKIKMIKTHFPTAYANAQIKFVMICLDESIGEGLRFIKKYGHWDEISIGKFYKNELALLALNKIKIPELPHILVFKDLLTIGKWNLPTIKERTLLVDLAGGEQINEWIDKGYPMPFKKNPAARSSLNKWFCVYVNGVIRLYEMALGGHNEQTKNTNWIVACPCISGHLYGDRMCNQNSSCVGRPANGRHSAVPDARRSSSEV